MNKLRTVALAIFILALSMIESRAAFCATPAKWQGYIIDRQCAESIREDPDPKSFIKHHNRDCSLMPNCRAVGYTLYTGGRWLDLDKKGNELTIKLLKATKRKRGFYVETGGTLEGKVLKVQSMKEIDEPATPEDPHQG